MDALVRQPFLPFLLPCLSHSEHREYASETFLCAHALLQVLPRKQTCSGALPQFTVTNLEGVVTHPRILAWSDHS